MTKKMQEFLDNYGLYLAIFLAFSFVGHSLCAMYVFKLAKQKGDSLKQLTPVQWSMLTFISGFLGMGFFLKTHEEVK